MNERPPDSPWLTKQEAADRARLPLTSIERALAAGELRSREIDGRTVTHCDWVDTWLDS